MPVEIRILSGSRQGERLRFDGDEITVGEDRSCDLRFNPHNDPGARGKRAILAYGEEGWRIGNCGSGQWLVNQSAVPSDSSGQLRSGDVVRVSESGPDFSFLIVSRAQQPTAISPPPAAEETGEEEKAAE